VLRIRLLQDGSVIDTIDAKWTINIDDIASEANALRRRQGAEDWEVVNDDGIPILTKERWENLRPDLV
jgi:hypothetical protein